MLRVTKLADYGIVMMTYVASRGGATHNARDIASEVRLPLPMVSKVLKQLVRGGLLVSQRGTKGGYGLARRPEQITVAQIIHALEGPIAVTQCTDKVRGDCDIETKCPVRTNWFMINQAIHGALEKITLAEMTQPLRHQLVTLIDPGTRAEAGTGTNLTAGAYEQHG
ncbi:MAG: system Fe-S cluster assembly regulator [Acidobacteria bacterium]|jgi:FeS assembly SUF system regulator|nr:system Fe-S cluster assembly regulator [Acidobacteriota bacterium]